jgi:hypothetical protein
MRRLLAVFLLSAALGGCAFGRALDRGHDLVAAQQYRAALAAYEQALRLDPDSEEARRLVAQIRPYALSEAERAAGVAVAAGRWEEAFELGAYVARHDSARGEKLRGAVEGDMRAAIDAQLAASRHEAAYALAVRARRLAPRMARLEATLAGLRARFYAEAESLSAAGRHEPALAALEVVARYEPEREAELDERRAVVRGRWADEVAAQARAAEAAGTFGAAAALYAHAVEIAARPEHLQALRAHARGLREQGAFVVRLGADGDAVRRDRLAGAVASLAASVEGVVVDDAAEAQLTLDLWAPPARCGDAEAVSTEAREYVAGTRLVPNAAHAELLARAEAVRDRVHRTRDALRRERARARRLDEQIAACRERVAEIARAGHGHDGECRAAAERAREAHAAVADLERELAALDHELETIEAELRATPAMLSEPVMDTYFFEVREVTRRCDATTSLRLAPSWEGAAERQLETHAFDSDTTHAAHARIDLERDPLELASVASVAAGADDRAADVVGAIVAAQARAYYRATARGAIDLAREQPDHASDVMVAALLAGPSHLDEALTHTMGQHLRARYGLRSWRALSR